MKHMPQFNIETTEQETRTNLPSFIIKDRLKPYLNAHRIEYRVITGDDIPDEWTQGWTFLGHNDTRHLAVVVSKLNSEQLIRTMEIINDVPDDEFAAYIKALK